MFRSRIWIGFWTAYNGFFLSRDIAQGEDPTVWAVLLVIWLAVAGFADFSESSR